MQSFIITFYRHGGETSPDLVIGTLESPVAGVERRFTSMAELHRMLDEEGRTWVRGKAAPRPHGQTVAPGGPQGQERGGSHHA